VPASFLTAGPIIIGFFALPPFLWWLLLRVSELSRRDNKSD